MASSFSGVGYVLKNSNATYLIKNNNGYVELKVYTSGWLGNKYGWTKPVKSIGKALGLFGDIATIKDVIEHCENIKNAENESVIYINYLDIAIDAIGYVPNPYCKAFSVFWSLGGEKIFINWHKNVIMPQVKDGTVGLMINQPFK